MFAAISNWNKETKEAIKKIARNELLEFKGEIEVNGITVEINRKSALEYTRSNYTDKLSKKSPEDFINKMRTAARLDNVLIATANFTNDGVLKKKRSDNFIDFYRGKTLFCIQGSKYEAEVLIAKTKNNKFIFYDLLAIQPSGFMINEKRKISSIVNLQNASNDMRDPSINSIPKNSEKVNTFDEKISKSLNDEDPPIADNNKKHSQDELHAELVALRKQLLEVCKKVNRSVDSLNKKQ